MFSSLALANVPTYNSWFAGGGIARPIARNLNIAATYTASFGGSTLQGCVSSCTAYNTYQTVTVDVQWHLVFYAVSGKKSGHPHASKSNHR